MRFLAYSSAPAVLNISVFVPQLNIIKNYNVNVYEPGAYNLSIPIYASYLNDIIFNENFTGIESSATIFISNISFAKEG